MLHEVCAAKVGGACGEYTAIGAQQNFDYRVPAGAEEQ